MSGRRSLADMHAVPIWFHTFRLGEKGRNQSQDSCKGVVQLAMTELTALEQQPYSDLSRRTRGREKGKGVIRRHGTDQQPVTRKRAPTLLQEISTQ